MSCSLELFRESCYETPTVLRLCKKLTSPSRCSSLHLERQSNTYNFNNLVIPFPSFRFSLRGIFFGAGILSIFEKPEKVAIDVDSSIPWVSLHLYEEGLTNVIRYLFQEIRLDNNIEHLNILFES